MASDPQGQMQFWDNGFPFSGIELGSNDAGQMQFWDNGFPMVYQFPVSTPAPTGTTHRPKLLLMGVG